MRPSNADVNDIRNTFNNHQHIQRFEVVASTGVRQDYLVLTTNTLMVGTYKIHATIIALGAVPGSEIDSTLIVDKGEIGEFDLSGPYENFGVFGGRFIHGAEVTLPLTAGEHTLTITHLNPNLPKVTDMASAEISIVRVEGAQV